MNEAVCAARGAGGSERPGSLLHGAPSTRKPHGGRQGRPLDQPVPPPSYPSPTIGRPLAFDSKHSFPRTLPVTGNSAPRGDSSHPWIPVTVDTPETHPPHRPDSAPRGHGPRPVTVPQPHEQKRLPVSATPRQSRQRGAGGSRGPRPRWDDRVQGRTATWWLSLASGKIPKCPCVPPPAPSPQVQAHHAPGHCHPGPRLALLVAQRDGLCLL